MMKVYIDIFNDKISGQMNMQRALKKYCERKNIYSDKENADFLIYVQAAFNQEFIDEWKRLKSLGKKIIFIHHYLDSELVDKVAILNYCDMYKLVDLHIIMKKNSDIYKKLLALNIKEENIAIIEQAATYREKLENLFFYKERKYETLSFVGRFDKGLEKFALKFENEGKFRKSIFCPDIHKSSLDYSNFDIYSNLCGKELFEKLAEQQFVYCPTIFHQTTWHLETIIHEANACGCAILVDKEFQQIVPNFEKFGFLDVDKFEYLDVEKTKKSIELVRLFLHEKYDDIETICKKNIEAIEMKFL